MAKQIERTAEIFAESTGLSALLAEREGADRRDIPIEQLLPNRHNPRQEYSKEALAELIQSIEEHGFIGALDGRELPDGRVELAYGSRRLLAARAAGIRSIPVFLHDWDDNQLLFIALVENLVREDLTLRDQAATVGQMRETLGLSIREMARKLGKSKAWVEDRLALYRAPDDVQEMIDTRPDAARAGRFISRLPDEENRRTLEQHILDQKITTRQVQQAVRQILDEGLPAEEALRRVTAPSEPPPPPEPAPPPPAVAPSGTTEAGETEAPPGQATALRKRRQPLPAAKLLLQANQALKRFDLEEAQVEEWGEFRNQLEQIVARANFLLKQIQARLESGG